MGSTLLIPPAEASTVGKYRLGPLLGSGGMGTVYAADHVVLGERVAVKFLHPELVSTPEFVERFLREARSLFRIHAENVVRILDVESPTSRPPFLVMEYVDGDSLEAILERRGRFELTEAIEIMRQTCVGVAEAHRLGIVHRDIKPHNIMVTARDDGTACVKLVDFGIAQIGATEAPAMATRLTATAAVIGTPCYMAPEQLRSARDADARSDVWSIGIVLFELLTGDRPWDAASPGDLVFRQYTEAVPLEAFGPGVPYEVAAIVMRCLTIDPAERWPSASKLAEALEPFAAPFAAENLLRATTRPPGPPGPDLTFARQKVRTTNGGTAFERHELVPRAGRRLTGASSHSVSLAAAPSTAKDPTLIATVIAVGAVLVVLGLLLLLVARRDAPSAPHAQWPHEPALSIVPPAAPAHPTTPTMPTTPTTPTEPAPPASARVVTAASSPQLAFSAPGQSRPHVAAPVDSAPAPTPRPAASPSLYTEKW